VSTDQISSRTIDYFQDGKHETVVLTQHNSSVVFVLANSLMRTIIYLYTSHHAQLTVVSDNDRNVGATRKWSHHLRKNQWERVYLFYPTTPVAEMNWW